MKPFKPIETERLLIRKMDIKDRAEFYRYRSLPAVYEYQSFQPTSILAVDDFIESIPTYANLPNTWFQLAICIQDSGKLIGDIGLHFLADNEQVEIGYTLAPLFQGQGYARESLRAVLSYLFFDLSKHRVTASVDPNNSRSIKLLATLAMRKEAHFIKSYKMNGLWLDDCVYAILADEWRTNHKDLGSI
ncbi:MAG: GNAT family N-acetyltransferase [Firmicutes bacterium]|nr:GNAT family N-acetyltransferase [Bacillota bacterium]